jgi:hypothetical protein
MMISGIETYVAMNSDMWNIVPPDEVGSSDDFLIDRGGPLPGTPPGIPFLVTLKSVGITKPSMSAVNLLTTDMEELRKEIRQLRDVISDLVSRASSAEVVLRNVSDEQALLEISAVLQSGESLYPSDLSHLLRLEYDQVMRTLETLRATGRAVALDTPDEPLT